MLVARTQHFIWLCVTVPKKLFISPRNKIKTQISKINCNLLNFEFTQIKFEQAQHVGIYFIQIYLALPIQFFSMSSFLDHSFLSFSLFSHTHTHAHILAHTRKQCSDYFGFVLCYY